MGTDSTNTYEEHARSFLQYRDKSKVGVRAASQWAKSLGLNAEVIEIACGGGIPVSQTLVDAGLKLWVIDSSPTLLDEFKDRFPDIPAQCGSILESDLFGRNFDAAISIGLIFLLCERDQIRMLHRVSEILLPNASFLFTAPLEAGTWTDVLTGHTCLSLGQDVYKKTLEQSGFRVIGNFEDSGKNNYYEAQKVVLTR